jgi:hypothetical protein
VHAWNARQAREWAGRWGAVPRCCPDSNDVLRALVPLAGPADGQQQRLLPPATFAVAQAAPPQGAPGVPLLPAAPQQLQVVYGYPVSMLPPDMLAPPGPALRQPAAQGGGAMPVMPVQLLMCRCPSQMVLPSSCSLEASIGAGSWSCSSSCVCLSRSLVVLPWAAGGTAPQDMAGQLAVSRRTDWLSCCCPPPGACRRLSRTFQVRTVSSPPFCGVPAEEGDDGRSPAQQAERASAGTERRQPKVKMGHFVYRPPVLAKVLPRFPCIVLPHAPLLCCLGAGAHSLFVFRSSYLFVFRRSCLFVFRSSCLFPISKLLPFRVWKLLPRVKAGFLNGS